MTEERKHAILLATIILTARKLQPLLDEIEREGKPNMAVSFWSEVYIKNAIERASDILDKIDEKWQALAPVAVAIKVSDCQEKP